MVVVLNAHKTRSRTELLVHLLRVHRSSNLAERLLHVLVHYLLSKIINTKLFKYRVQK